MKTIKYILFILVLSGLSFSQPLFYEQTSGVTTPLNFVYPTGWAGSNVVAAWICGDNGVVLKTTVNGGAWLNASIPSTMNLNTIMSNRDNSIMALTAGVINDTAVVYRTTNAGTNWSVVFRQYQGNINAVYFSNSTGIMIGNPVGGRWSIWRTTNQGLTFDSTGMYLPRAGSESGFHNSFFVCNGGTYVFMGTNNSRVYYTTNMGNNWSFIPFTPEANSYMVNFPGCSGINNLLGYVGGTSKVFFTSNSGANWTETVTAPGSGNVSGLVACPLPVSMIGQHDIMITRNTGTIYRMMVGSPAWSNAYIAPAGNYKYISGNINNFYTYAVRDNGGISWGSCGTYGVLRISDIIPVDYALSQNYPNPFNPVTKIVFDIPKASKVRISVYDITGREVSRLVDFDIMPGKYETEWDASAVSSGIYFYSLLTEDYTQTKKMVLVK